jgi:uncharacterized protein DUF4395
MSSALSREIDVRGPRFAAAVTAVVLAVALVLGSGVLAAVQAVVFAVGAFAGLRYAPYGVLFRAVVAPRLGPVRELDVRRTPTLFYLDRTGQLIGRSSGAPRADELTALVDAHVGARS